MKRRQAIQNILAASAATIFLTGCSDKQVVDLISDGKIGLDQTHLDYLQSISEAFLPVQSFSDEVQPANVFIMYQVNELGGAEEIQKFATGFDNYKLLMQESRIKIKSSKEDDVILIVKEKLQEELVSDDLVLFINTVKDLSIQNFTTSEYYMTNNQNYSMIPEAYESCINI